MGTLEYRDYSEPAGSAKRVKLPTWLTVAPNDIGLLFSYVYDDGPTKTVTEIATVRIDAASRHYLVTGKDGKDEENSTIEGLDQLKQGRGSLILRGTGIENKAAVDVRTTIRIGRNILEITRETGPSGTPLVFRHAYTFIRSVPPLVNSSH